MPPVKHPLALAQIPRRASTVTPARVSSSALLGERGELIITPDGREYRLRVTQNGKLILTA
jgi:hemin uptake protein HemP